MPAATLSTSSSVSISVVILLEQKIDKRIAVYRDKFGASDTITISNPADVETDMLTQCISPLSDGNARSFLSKSTQTCYHPKSKLFRKKRFNTSGPSLHPHSLAMNTLALVLGQGYIRVLAWTSSAVCTIKIQPRCAHNFSCAHRSEISFCANIQ